MSKTEYKITVTRLSLVGSLSLVGMTVLSGLFLSSSTTSAEDVVDEINITVPVSCSLSGTGMTSHTATIENGRYVSDIGTTTLKAFCNDNNGFAIYATGYTGNEIGQENSNKLVGTPSTIGNISTGTATSGDTSNWSMKLATTSTPTPTYPIIIDNSFNTYQEVPNKYTKVAHRDGSTDIGEDAEGATLTTTYASYISKTQAAGAYAGKVIYTLVHPSNEEPPHEVACEAGKICYNPNTTTALGEMGKQTTRDVGGFNTGGNITSNSPVTLYASNFSRSGYGFAGWNTAYDYSGTNYGPNETIAAPINMTNGLSLYAVWIKSAGILQNWNGCSSMKVGDVTALTDNRDSNTYAVAKLADNKCWMIENLRLNNDASHNADGLQSQGYDSSFVGLADSESANFTDSIIANTLYSTDGSTAITISGSHRSDRFPRYNNNNISNRQSASNYTTEGNIYSYGNYYTWSAAVADTSDYDTYGQIIGSTSLCPTGWRLPKGGGSDNSSNSDLWNLGTSLMGFAPSNNSYYQSSETNTRGKNATQEFRSYPNNFLYAGYYPHGSASSRSSYGQYWSSTMLYSGVSYGLQLYQTTVGIANQSNKYFGLSIRCLMES